MSHLQALPDGTELVSDYRIERVIGAGGFGITYLATEIALDRQVTIKEYFPGDFAARGDKVDAQPRSHNCATDYQWGLDRFIEEAQTLAKYDHPNIVRVYRYFRANNTGYMVLHFEEGQSLKGWLQSLGRAPRQAEMDQMIAPLLDALAVVHASDFLHRDIAPDNIIIRNDGSPVLIDFGAARGDVAQHSRTVSALVKPGYSPYEQYGEIGRQQGPWTDIYALAATLYHAITGKRPPDAPSRVVKDEIRPARDAALSAYRPSFLKAIDSGLKIDIDKRPQSIAAWRGALLAPDASAGHQRGWFGTKRSDKAVDAQSSLDDGAPQTAAATRALTSPPPPVAEVVPPPPDVPGRRGRIVDFLDGVRQTPRASVTEALPAATEKEAVVAAPPAPKAGAPAPPATPAKRAGLFWRKSEANPPAPASTKVAAKDRPVVQRSAPNLPPKRKRKRAQERRPPRPRPVRTKSRWRWFPLATKLAIGVAVATFLVRLQQTLPHIEFSSSGTVASSAVTPPQDIAARPAAKPPIPQPQQRQAVGSIKRRDAGADAASTTVAALDRNDRPPVKREPETLLLRTFEAHAGGTAAVHFGRGGKLASIGGDGTLKVWDTATSKLLRTLELEHGPAQALAVAGNRALTGHENGRIGLWDLELGMQLKSFKRNDAPITSLAFAGNDKFLAGGHDWTVALWEVATPSGPLHVFEGHGRDVLTVAYEPTRGLIASGSADRTVRLWEAKSLSHIRTYPRAKNFITALAFSPDGGAVLIGTLSGRISLYSTNNRRRKQRFRGHSGRITSLEFIDGGREFVSASADGTVRLWNRRVGRARQTFGSAGAKISNAAVSPDGRMIATGKDNGTVQIWNGAVLD